MQHGPFLQHTSLFGWPFGKASEGRACTVSPSTVCDHSPLVKQANRQTDIPSKLKTEKKSFSSVGSAAYLLHACILGPHTSWQARCKYALVWQCLLYACLLGPHTSRQARCKYALVWQEQRLEERAPDNYEVKQ